MAEELMLSQKSVYRLEVTNKVDDAQDGQVGVEFYINTRALGNTP